MLTALAAFYRRNAGYFWTGVFVTLAHASSAMAQDNTPNALGVPGGRYVFGQISSMRADQFLLDTHTGRVWQIVVNEKGLRSFSPIPYQSIDGNQYLGPPVDSFGDSQHK